jgi:hypothetical protein
VLTGLISGTVAAIVAMVAFAVGMVLAAMIAGLPDDFYCTEVFVFVLRRASPSTCTVFLVNTSMEIIDSRPNRCGSSGKCRTLVRQLGMALLTCSSTGN